LLEITPILDPQKENPVLYTTLSLS